MADSVFNVANPFTWSKVQVIAVLTAIVIAPIFWARVKRVWAAILPSAFEDSLAALLDEIEEQKTSLREGHITFVAPKAGKRGRQVKLDLDPLEEHAR